MADDLNKSSTPEVGGDNQSAANQSYNQGESNPEEKVTPTKRMPRKWFGFTKIKWREIAAFIVLVPWIYVETFDTHNFIKLLMLATSLAVTQAVVCSYFKNHTKSLVIWLLSLIPLACIVWLNSRPQPESITDKKIDTLFKIATDKIGPLPPDVVSNIVSKLRQPHPTTAVVIHAFDPDPAAYLLANQLKKIFFESGYVIFHAPPPQSVEEVPGVSFVLYTTPTAGLVDSISIILKETGSPPEFMLSPGDADSWYGGSNSVIFISIKKKW